MTKSTNRVRSDFRNQLAAASDDLKQRLYVTFDQGRVRVHPRRVRVVPENA